MCAVSEWVPRHLLLRRVLVFDFSSLSVAVAVI